MHTLSRREAYNVFLRNLSNYSKEKKNVIQCFSIQTNIPSILVARLERVSSGSANLPMNELIDDAFNGIHAGF